MFGRKKDKPVSMTDKLARDQLVQEIQDNLRRIVADEIDKRFTIGKDTRPVVLVKSQGTVFSANRYSGGEMVMRDKWYAKVGEHRICGKPSPHSVHTLICEGFDTPAQADKAAKEYVDSRPIVRGK